MQTGINILNIHFLILLMILEERLSQSIKQIYLKMRIYIISYVDKLNNAKVLNRSLYNKLNFDI